MAGPKFRQIHLYIFRTLLVTFVFLPLEVVAAIFFWKDFKVYGWLELALACEVILHHVSSVFRPTALPNLLDLILVLAELSVWITLLAKVPEWFELHPAVESRISIIYLISKHVQIVALHLLLCFRIRRLVGAKRKPLFIQFAFESATDQKAPMPWYSILFGTSVFRSRYVRETSNITVADFKSSINVMALWEDGDPTKSCKYESQGVRDTGNETDICVGYITFLCSGQNGLIGRGIFYNNFDLVPDLLVTVNFTSLNMSFNSLANARRRTVSILVGLTQNDSHVISNTVPTPLFPGSHLYASVSLQVRQIFVTPSLASVGSFAPSRSFLTTNLISLATDPSPLINRLENTATLRIYTQNDVSDWTIVQDYRENFVLDGFADVGGFWAFINGLFALLFGSTLATIIFGWKRLSIFGVLDRIGKGELRDHFHKEYPKLKEEVSSSKDQRGHLALLREHLIGFDILDHEEHADSTQDAGTGSRHPEMAEQSKLLSA